MEKEIKYHLENNRPEVFEPDYLIASEAVHLELPNSPSQFVFKIADFGICKWISKSGGLGFSFYNVNVDITSSVVG